MRKAWRRAVVLMAGGMLLSACDYKATPDPILSARDKEFISKVPTADMGRNFDRYEVEDPTGQAPGTIVVNTKDKLLYYVLGHGRAMRYGVATGAEAYGWRGVATVRRMAEWPRWMPPPDMVKRWPHLKPVVAEGGMPGGPENPLGARALYLYDSAGRDTLYRIHGTNEPTEIGHDASSGCIRMRDIDVIDLYSRAKVGSKVVVM